MVFSALAAASIALNLWQWLAAQRFSLHKTPPNSKENLPGVTCLKPLKGCDHETRGCLESWFLQKYPGAVQIIFGVASHEDPVCAVVRSLISEHPTVNAELIIAAPILGPNGKVSTLTHLQRVARHEILVISDADVAVDSYLLVKLVSELEVSGWQLLNCFYALKPASPAMKWEAIAVNADFWSQVLQGLTLRPMSFALGAVIATRAAEVRKMGGFGSLLEYLADDYELGNRIWKTGGKLGLSSAVVECRSHPMTWKETWNHQLRWARTIRVCQPGPYFLSVLNNATIWPLLWTLWDRSILATGVMILSFALRLITAASNYARLYPARSCNPFWMAPIKDLLQLPIWALSFMGNTVSWRGERFTVTSTGKLKRID